MNDSPLIVNIAQASEHLVEEKKLSYVFSKSQIKIETVFYKFLRRVLAWRWQQACFQELSGLSSTNPKEIHRP